MLVRLSRQVRFSQCSSQSIRRPSVRPIPPVTATLCSSRMSSTGATAGTDSFSLLSPLKNVLYGISITLSLAFSYLYITDTRASIHRWISVPALLFFYPDAEEAHRAGTSFLKYLYASSLHPHERGSLDALDNLIIRDRFRAYPAKPHCHVCGHRQTWRNP